MNSLDPDAGGGNGGRTSQDPTDRRLDAAFERCSAPGVPTSPLLEAGRFLSGVNANLAHPVITEVLRARIGGSEFYERLRPVELFLQYLLTGEDATIPPEKLKKVTAFFTDRSGEGVWRSNRDPISKAPGDDGRLYVYFRSDALPVLSLRRLYTNENYDLLVTLSCCHGRDDPKRRLCPSVRSLHEEGLVASYVFPVTIGWPRHSTAQSKLPAMKQIDLRCRQKLESGLCAAIKTGQKDFDFLSDRTIEFTFVLPHASDLGFFP